MSYLIDTNVFLRLVSRKDADRTVVLEALRKLRDQREVPFYTTQVLAEFWTVCTRPASARGGYGLSREKTERKARVIERYCHLLPDSVATHQEWRRLIVSHSISGVGIHDARLVAAMIVHGVSHILTFNRADFSRFSGISVVSPADVH